MFEIIVALLIIFSPLLCWNELMKIRRILERMAGDGNGISPDTGSNHHHGGAYSSASKGWNR